MDDFQVIESNPFFEATVQLVRPTDSGTDISVLLSVSTNLPQYARKNYSLTRTLSEFDRLHLHLMNTSPEYIGPAAPPKSANLELVRTALERFLLRLSRHEQLRIADGTRLFIESEFIFAPAQSPPVVRRVKEQKSLFSFALATEAKEIDVYFENAKQEIQACEAYFSAIGRINEKIAIVLSDIGRSSVDVSYKLATVGIDQIPVAAVPFQKTAKCFAVEDEVLANELHMLQINYRQNVLNDQCLLLLRSNMGAQTSLNHRSSALVSYEASCKNTQKKMQAMERLRTSSSIRQDKVDAALDELADAKRTESDCRDTFKRLSDSLRKEYTRHISERATDLSSILDDYVQHQLDFSKQLLTYWKTV
ncbi:hypothetical protein BATDEDRAFT_87677 [Batrachochytrium dendrobatidis JAM81]|uniref:PX domain-containing protein n=2 Tax=Batrachochytrium dendrobatidis TaxID=109871 RepID=F4P0H4_BATDJ|nr:uncharacterized protein BATDEDRAFT_87677 [Batrachochytrium dendrobatidis JAM81]EGF81589.1 hypothetical protein BATDEDRAFT_87677 [Batrachochytrium dendrobatidis JAM81]|eukprot:XP_006678252.1 hypothetical protein BATDEDRAFT_87677 [Batrachochytrium dendrobatidis JAM81]